MAAIHLRWSRLVVRTGALVRTGSRTGAQLHAGPAARLAAPGLEHQHRPQRRSRVAAPGEVLLPAPANDSGVEIALFRHPRGIEQVLGPRTQRPLDPFADRNGEAGLRPLEQSARRLPVE